ncbi:MAG: mycothiol synthase [Acidimicrobiales bacterium]
MGQVEVAPRDDEDAPGITAFLQSVRDASGSRPIDDDSWGALVAGRPAGSAGFVARATGSGRVVGYAQLNGEPGSWQLAYVVDPALTGGLVTGRALCGAALDLVARQGGGHVRCWVRMATATSDEIAASVGLTCDRELHQMRRPLPWEPDGSAPLATRPFRVGEDESVWLELNNRVFAAHPEQGSWTAVTLSGRERQPWFDPDGFLLYELDEKMIAFCWTKVHDDEPPIGEIYVLGVDPAVRAHGIGSGMLRAGLELLSAKGLRTAMLYVEADNSPAIELYAAAGFVVDHEDRSYVGDVGPAG